MRGSLAGISAAVTSLVAVAFLVPLAVVVGDVARDRVLAEAFRSAAAIGPVLVLTTREEDVARVVSGTAEGSAGRFADYKWDFVLDVADRVRRQRPGVQFATSSYGYARNPPKSVGRIPPEFVINLCQNSTTPSFAADLVLREE